MIAISLFSFPLYSTNAESIIVNGDRNDVCASICLACVDKTRACHAFKIEKGDLNREFGRTVLALHETSFWVQQGLLS
jgi:hypothetical protein